MKKAALSLVLFSLLFIPAVHASESVNTIWQSANSEVYGTKAGGMLGRGVLNIATCFVDLIVHVVDGTKQGPPLVGTMTGLGSGLGCTALRVSSGALDVVTFWVPDFNGFGFGKGTKNIRNDPVFGIITASYHVSCSGACYCFFMIFKIVGVEKRATVRFNNNFCSRLACAVGVVTTELIGFFVGIIFFEVPVNFISSNNDCNTFFFQKLQGIKNVCCSHHICFECFNRRYI